MRARVEATVGHCRFRTSYGGAWFCQEPSYLEGFCRFHFQAFQRGEINELGVISEKLDDQVRRREINFHGIAVPSGTYVREDGT